MLRNLGIRWQILSALALPVLVLGLISSQVTYQALVDMREASQSRELSQAAGGFADLVGGLQAERALSVATLIGRPGAQAQLKTVRAAVDQGLATVRARVYSDSSSDALKQILARSATGHAGLAALRTEVDGGKVLPRAVVTRYSQVIAADVAVPSDLANTFRSQDVATNFQEFAELSVAGEALSQEQLVGAAAILSGKADVSDQRALGADQAAGAQALANFRRIAQGAQLTGLETALAAKTARSAELTAARTAFGAAGVSSAPAVTLDDWTAITTAQLTAMRGALDNINQDGIKLSSADYDAAKSKLQLTLGGAIGITLLTLVLALLLSRRISAPLRRLTLAATQIRDELPKIVETAQNDEDYELDLPVVQILGRNEVSQLAAAFVDVNAVTVAIAREQARLRAAVADMFVNVARRNQVLLSRQLSLIDQLERNEVNPDALEELFRLDHLATRMRRNAESLLVLAGIESGRRLREPMPLSDVVRTATSEIEHYSRVSLSLAADPPVYAHLALPIAHLLAELLENATNFSDPGSTVVVMASATQQGVRMTVADDGLGIPAEELLEINARIDEPPTAEALSSQRLGFFVVGRLAQRLDAKVTLTSGRARGTAVLIDLPSSLFVPGSLDDSMYNLGGSTGQEQSALAGIPDQGGAPTWTPEPVGALAGAAPGSGFVAAFPNAPAALSAGTAAAPAAAAPALPAPTPATLPALPAAFNSAAFDAVNALEPVWSPQPDYPATGAPAPIVEPAAGPVLPARRGVPAPAEPLTVPQLLPRATVEPAVTPPSVPQPANPVEAPPEWADSDWAVSQWSAPAEVEPAEAVVGPPTEQAPNPSLFSGFRSRQAATEPEAAAPETAGRPDPVVPVVLNPTPQAPPTPLAPVFLDSATAVDDWFGAGPTAAPEANSPFEPPFEQPAVPATPSAETEPDRWQAWDEVATDVSAPVEPAPIPALADPTPVAWAPEPAEADSAPIWTPTAAPQAPPSEAWTPQSRTDSSEPAVSAPVAPAWSPEPVAAPVAEPWSPELSAPAWAPTPGPTPPVPEGWSPEAAPVAESWSPEPAPVAEVWSPELAPAWSPEPAPVAEAWSPEPAPVVEAWSPEPATAAWTPEPATYPPTPEVWSPEAEAPAWAPEPEAQPWSPEAAPAWQPEAAAPAWPPEAPVPGWAPEPEAWSPVPQPESRPPAAAEPLMQTLTAAIDILPQRTSIRTALRRGRRKGDPQPSTAQPFNGGFDPIAPAREFARREGFGPTEPEPVADGRSAEPAAGPASGLVPEPTRSWDSAGSTTERRQHPRTGDQEAQGGRSALASEALTELSRLSSYSPTSMPSSDQAGLQRRTPSEVPIDEPQPVVDGAGQRGARTAASVRSMLAGFKAGVERGRTSPAANRPAPTLPPPPRSSSSEDPQ